MTLPTLYTVMPSLDPMVHTGDAALSESSARCPYIGSKWFYIGA